MKRIILSYIPFDPSLITIYIYIFFNFMYKQDSTNILYIVLKSLKQPFSILTKRYAFNSSRSFHSASNDRHTRIYIYISRARELNLKMTEILKQDYNKTAPFI